jgi:dipeptidyl aminopeptidase/acylaminoacyl peptidase
MLIRPKNSFPAKRGILYVHGREDGSSGNGAISFRQYVERYKLFEALGDAGHVILSCDFGGIMTWGNNTVISRISAAVAYLLSSGLVLPNEVALLGTSMGGLNSLAWAAANLNYASCMIGIIPVVNLTDMHANNRGGFAAEINAAYGGSYSEASFGAVHNPATIAIAGGYSALPIQLWYGNTDTVAVPAAITAFGASVGAGCELHEMSGGHSEAIVAQVSATSILSFIAAAG